MAQTIGTVFISWSGERSKAVAEALHHVLQCAMPQVEFIVSSRDLLPGTHWFEKLSEWLNRSHMAIICLTPENLHAPWVMFEAGAVSRAVGKSLVIPYAFGIPIDRIGLPLSGFHGLRADRDGTKGLFEGINKAFKKPISEDNLNEVFDTWWPALNKSILAIHELPPSAEQTASQLIQFNPDDAVSRFSPIRAQIKKCKAGDVVRIIAVTGYGLFTPHVLAGQDKPYVEALERGVIFKGVVMDPSSQQALDRASVESPSDALGTRLLEADAVVVKNWLKSRYDNGVRTPELRYSRSLFSFALVMVRDVAFIEPYHLGKVSDVPHLCGFSIMQCPHGTHDYEVAAKHFEYLFENGSPIE